MTRLPNNNQLESDYRINFFRKPALQFSVVLLLFVTAFAVRLYHIDRPPYDFATLRQYQSAHIARAYYFDSLKSLPEWKRTVAKLNLKRMGLLLEPRILENMTVIGYRLTGGEHLWIPRALSSIFWMIGGIFLYLTSRKIISPEAAFFSTAFYLLFPFSISASRSFQPDPLMIMLLLISVFLVVRYYDHPTSANVIGAALVTALAVLAKPYSLFFIFGAFVSVGIFKHGLRKALFGFHFILFSVLSLIPACFYYVYGILTNVGYLNELAQGSFLPHLILKSYFWKDWLSLIGNVVGYIAFAAALTGFLTMKRGLSKAFLSGLWAGYLIFGLFFTLHIHTHDYYHLPLIPIVAFSLGSVAVRAMKFLYRNWKISLLTFLGLVCATGIIVANRNLRSFISKKDLQIIAKFVGVSQHSKDFIVGDFSREVKMAKEIGDLVGHSTNTVLLTHHFGRALAYNGELSGLPWPTSFSLQERRERGLKDLSDDELFNLRYFTIRTHGKYIRYVPDFFIITDFDDWERQKNLRDFLSSNFPVLARTDDYLIFDTRKMSGNKAH